MNDVFLSEREKRDRVSERAREREVDRSSRTI